MGFAIEKVEKALKQTKNSGLQPAMDYLIEHADDIEANDTIKHSESVESVESVSEVSELTAQSLKCDDCGRVFKDCTFDYQFMIQIVS